MLLDKIFTPKWKHKNPQVRKRSLLGLDPRLEQTQHIFMEVVNNDPELFIRRLAIQRLTDIDAVQALRQADQNKEIYQEASKRLCELLSSVSEHRTFKDIKARLDVLGEARILEYVAKHTKDEALQKFALQKIDNEMVLADVLVATGHNDIRKLILEKLDNVNALKRIIKSLKRKDKAIAALAQEKLDQLNEIRERTREIQNEYRRVGQNFLDLFKLCKLSQEWTKYELRLRGLHEQWRGLSVSLDDVSRNHHQLLAQQVEQSFALFEEELQKASARSDWEVPQQTTNSDAIETLQSLSEQAQDRLKAFNTPLQDIASQHEQLTEFVSSIKQQWRTTYDKLMDEAGIALPTADLPQTKSAFETALAELEDIAGQLPQLETWQRQITAIVDDAQKLLASENMVAAKEVDRLERRYAKLTKPSRLAVDKESTAQYQQAIKGLRDKLLSQEQQRQSMVEEFSTLCQELQDAVKQGRSKHSTHLLNRGKKLLKNLDEAGRKLLDKRGDAGAFQAASRQLEELQDWRKWSSASVKEQLIKDMQQLAGETADNADNPDFDFVAAADAVKAAREEWKKLTAGEKAPDLALWQAFDDACNQAYQPCQSYFERLGEQRVANLQQRERICQELESYLETVQQKVQLQKDQPDHPDDIDWKAMERIIRTARHDWGRLGIVNRGDRAEINKRFNHALNALDKLLRSHKQVNLDAKQALIKRVEYIATQLKEQALTLEQAIDAVKEAQSKWKTIGPAAREKTNWKQFRAACDSVFAVRNAEQEAQQQEREQEKQQRIQLIDNIEHAARSNGDALRQARTQIEQLKGEWHELPKLAKSHALERRFNDACKRFDKQLEQLLDAQLSADKHKLQQNARICYQLEAEIFQCLSGVLQPDQLKDSAARLGQHWQSLESSKLKSVETSIKNRFQHLNEYVEKITLEGVEDIKQFLQNNENMAIHQKDNLCIQMEVLANVESPPESRQRRMEYQVSQLAEKMKQANANNTKSEIENLLVQWHRSGLINPAVSQSFEQRFYLALQSLDKDYQYDNKVII